MLDYVFNVIMVFIGFIIILVLSGQILLSLKDKPEILGFNSLGTQPYGLPVDEPGNSLWEGLASSPVKYLPVWRNSSRAGLRNQCLRTCRCNSFYRDQTKYMPITISQILQASWKPAIHALTEGTKWVSPSMRCKERHGFIQHISLGARVEQSFIDPSGTISSRSYPIEEITIPITWTIQNELLNPTERNKINFVQALIGNTLNTHDHLIARKMRGKKAIVSKEYRYRLCETINSQHSDIFIARVYTALAFIDRNLHG